VRVFSFRTVPGTMQHAFKAARSTQTVSVRIPEMQESVTSDPDDPWIGPLGPSR